MELSSLETLMAHGGCQLHVVHWIVARDDCVDGPAVALVIGHELADHIASRLSIYDATLDLCQRLIITVPILAPPTIANREEETVASIRRTIPTQFFQVCRSLSTTRL